MTTLAPEPIVRREKNLADLVNDGAGKISDWITTSHSSWDTLSQTEESLRGRPEAFLRCLTRYWYQEIHHQTPEGMLRETRPTSWPCNTRGCPRCGEHHARRDFHKWTTALDKAYPKDEVLLSAHLTLPGHDLATAHDIVKRFRLSRPIKESLKETIGFVSISDGGCEFQILLTESALVAHSDTIELGWKALVPDGELWLEQALSDPFEAAVEMKVGAEQAPFKLVALGAIEPSAAIDAITGEKARNRIVFGSGFRALAKDGNADEQDRSAQISSKGEPSPPPSYVDENGAGPEAEVCNLGHPDCRPIIRKKRIAWWNVQPKIDSGVLQAVRDVYGDLTYVDVGPTARSGG